MDTKNLLKFASAINFLEKEFPELYCSLEDSTSNYPKLSIYLGNYTTDFLQWNDNEDLANSIRGWLSSVRNQCRKIVIAIDSMIPQPEFKIIKD